MTIEEIVKKEIEKNRRMVDVNKQVTQSILEALKGE